MDIELRFVELEARVVDHMEAVKSSMDSVMSVNRALFDRMEALDRAIEAVRETSLQGSSLINDLAKQAVALRNDVDLHRDRLDALYAPKH